MRTINTGKKISSWLLIGAGCMVLGASLAGCVQRNDLKQALEAVAQSEAYYQMALTEYKGLIAQKKDRDKLYLELGKVYYGHGDLSNAIEAFKNSASLEAKKFLAISLYKSGNFTDALEIFNKNEIPDNEYLYYHGLTCEKLNLFDEALKNYKKLEGKAFREKAKSRIDIIEKQINLINIKDSDPQAYKIIQGAPEAMKYPDAGALILLSDESVEVTSENSQVMYLHYIVKVLNERGKKDFSEAQIGYDSTYDRVELEYARTIKPDGSVVDVGSRHIRDVSRYLNFPLYSNARVYIISFPEIAEGACIEYKLKIYRNQLINKKDFVISYPLQSQEPVILARFNVNLPKEKPLNIKVINNKYNSFGANLSAMPEEKNGRLIYRWEFKETPQIIPEANMPPNVEVNPTLLISTFNSWKEIYDWWWGLTKDKITADAAIKDKARELIRDKTSQLDKAKAIYNFCSQNIRYVAVEYGQAGYEPHNASDIFKNKYGDCKDKAILLITMLKEAGISSWPVLIATKEYYNLNDDFPAMLFNHAIAALELNEKIIFLDPTAETCSFQDLPADDQARKVLIIKPDTYKIEDTPLYPGEHNLIKQSLSIKVNSDEGILAEKQIFSFGLYDQAQRYWLTYTQPELIQETLKTKIQDTSIGARLDSYNIENLDDLNSPVILSYDFNGPEYFTQAGALRIMPQLGNIDTSMVARERRIYPLDFNILDSKESVVKIKLPDNFRLKYLPDDVTEDSPWLKFSAEYKHNKDEILFSQRAELKKNMVLQEEYADFKKFFEGLAKKVKQRIVLEKIK